MTNLSILAIDDNRDNLVSLEALLADGFPAIKILLAQTGQDGIRMALTSDPDVILLDIVMPGMDGFEVCRKLKADDRSRHIPVLFLTALQTGQDSRIRALEVGAEGFLAKPIDEFELVAQVRAMAKIKAANTAVRLEKDSLAKLVSERTQALEHELAERKQAEDSLRQAHNELSAIHANVPVALLLIDRERRVRKMNAAAELLVGRGSGEALGLGAGEAIRCLHSLDDPRGCGFGASCGSCPIRVAVQETFADRQPRQQVEAWLSVTTGPEPELRCLLVATAYLELNGEPAVLLSAQDITDRKSAEQALYASEKLYRSVINASPDNITITDLEGRILMVSPAGLAIFGYEREESLIGRSIDAFVAPEDLERAQANLKLMSGGNSLTPREYQALRRDGTRISIEVNGEFIHDADGKRSRMIFVVRDISERKKTEEVLAFLARSSGSAPEGGFFRSLAKFLAETLEMDFVCIDRLEGDHLTARTVAVWCDGVFEDNVVYALKDTPCGEVVGKTVCCFSARVCELFPRDKVLEDLKAESYAGVTLWGHDGQPVGLIAVISRFPMANRSLLETVLRMVSVRAASELERLEAEDALRRSEERYRRVSSVMSDIAYACVQLDSGAYQMDWVEGAAERLLGYTVEELVALKCWGVLVLAEDLPGFTKTVLGCPPGASGSLQLRLRHKDGSIRWVAVSVRCLVSPDQPLVQRLFGGLTDITERKQAEERLFQAQKMESIGRLAGGVAHDFNNLLTVINGYSQMLMEECGLDGHVRDQLNEIYKAGSRAAALTQQMLAFSRKQVLQPQVLEFDRLFGDMSRMLDRLVGEDVQLEIHLAAGAATVYADPHQLGQVVMNLVVNARDAMPGGGRLWISTAPAHWTAEDARSRPGSGPGDYVVLEVADTGVGMDEETRRFAFEPFFTTKGVGQGTGLGLSMVQGIVAQSNGFIEVQSELGKGTTFSIFLPRVESRQADAPAAAEASVPGGKETIMVVEDQVEVRSYVAEVLRLYGYRVLEAEDGEEALRLCDTGGEGPDLILTDVVMPVLGGRDLAKLLGERNSHARILFMSGYTDDEIVRQGVLHEAMHLIHKPFSPTQLARRVREILGAPGAARPSN